MNKYFLNIPLAEFTQRVLNNGRISAKGYFLLLMYYLKIIISIPFAFFQYLVFSKRINKTVIKKPPVFILGHYRSGTTWLHKLLSADKGFGFMSYYDMICPNTSLLFGKLQKNMLQFLISKLKFKTAFFNNVVPSLDEPAEEERYLINKSSAYADYWKFIFPLKKNVWQSNSLDDPQYYQRWKKNYTRLLKMITYKTSGRQLIIKSPCNTERIKYLLEIFPDAKFIYISRNPSDVFYSTVNLWQKAIKKFCLQKISSQQIEEIIFEHYCYLLSQYKNQKHLIPEGNLVEILYEELQARPVASLKKIYKQLNIPDFHRQVRNFIKQVSKDQRYKNYTYAHDEETLNKVNVRWAKYIAEWQWQYFNSSVNDLMFL